MTTLDQLAVHVTMATSGMATVRELAVHGDAAVPLIAPVLDQVATSLGALAGRDAQRLIGPRVNFATTAQMAVSSLAREAGSGVLPTTSGLDDATRAVNRLALGMPTST